MSSCSVSVSVLGSVLYFISISCTSGQAMLVKCFPLWLVVASLTGERGPGLIEDGLPLYEPPRGLINPNSEPTDHRPLSAQDLRSYLVGLGGLSPRATKGKLVPRSLFWLWELVAEHEDIPTGVGEMILGPLCVEFVSTFVGEDAFVNEGFLGCELAKPHTLAGMPIGGGEVILMLILRSPKIEV